MAEAGEQAQAVAEGHGCALGQEEQSNVLGLIDEEIDGEDRTVTLPDMGWVTVRGRTAELGKIYEKIYQEGRLEYEIERFTDSGDCEIMYCRSTDRDK